jgi:hypothetical protein
MYIFSACLTVFEIIKRVSIYELKSRGIHRTRQKCCIMYTFPNLFLFSFLLSVYFYTEITFQLNCLYDMCCSSHLPFVLWPSTVVLHSGNSIIN